MRCIPLIAALLSVAATTVGRAGDDDTEKAVRLEHTELLKLSRRIDDALVKADTAFLAEVLADDWMAIEPRGIRDKAALLKALKEGSTKFTAIKTADLKVRVHGDAAVVTGHYFVESLSRERAGIPSNELGSFGRVFARKGGKWQYVHSQSTPNVGWGSGGGRPAQKER
jgi:ketosteroid isomerase-like protein